MAAESNLRKVQRETLAKRNEFFSKADKIYKDRVRKENVNEDTDGDRVYDECIQMAKKKYPKLHAAVKKEADVRNELNKLEKDIGKQIMGKYADTPIGLTETYGSVVGSAVYDRIYYPNMDDEDYKYW